MVLDQTNKRKTINIVMAVLAIIVVIATICATVFVVTSEQDIEPTDDSTSESTDDNNEDDEDDEDDDWDGSDYYEEEPPARIDFQPVIDSWVNSVGGNKGIVIYDLTLGDVVGEYNANQKFATASLYKLFVVYEGYRRLDNETWSKDDLVGATNRPVIDCLDLAIRVSHSPCAETLWGMIGRDELNAIVQTDFNLPDMWVTSLSATPYEIADMMSNFYYHTEIDDEELVSRMQDSFLNQPKTDYDWRQGLPSGFSEAAKVYNKVGWNYDPSQRAWTIYDDAAIVEFTEAERDYVVVVMTNYVDYSQIKRLGSEIEAKFME